MGPNTVPGSGQGKSSSLSCTPLHLLLPSIAEGNPVPRYHTVAHRLPCRWHRPRKPLEQKHSAVASPSPDSSNSSTGCTKVLNNQAQLYSACAALRHHLPCCIHAAGTPDWLTPAGIAIPIPPTCLTWLLATSACLWPAAQGTSVRQSTLTACSRKPLPRASEIQPMLAP